jgi:hypothetical protein
MENFLDTTYVPSIAQRRATHEEMDRPYDRPYSDYIVGGFQFTDLSQAHLYVATVKNQLHQQALGWRPARKDISISNRNENNPLFDTVLPDGQIRLTCTYEAVHFDARLLRWCTYIRALSNRGVYKIGCFEDPADAAYAHYVVLKDEHPRRKLKPPVSRTELFDYHAVHRAIERTLHSLPPRLE